MKKDNAGSVIGAGILAYTRALDFRARAHVLLQLVSQFMKFERKSFHCFRPLDFNYSDYFSEIDLSAALADKINMLGV